MHFQEGSAEQQLDERHALTPGGGFKIKGRMENSMETAIYGPGLDFELG